MTDLKVILLGNAGEIVNFLPYLQIKCLAQKYEFFKNMLNNIDQNKVEFWNLQRIKEKVFYDTISYLINDNDIMALSGLTGFELMELKELLKYFNIKLPVNFIPLEFNRPTIIPVNYIINNNNNNSNSNSNSNSNGSSNNNSSNNNGNSSNNNSGVVVVKNYKPMSYIKINMM